MRRARWFAAVVAVPAVLAGLALVWPGRQMSDDLRQPSEQALDAAGPAGTVTADAAQADPVPAAPTAAQPTPGKGDVLAPAERERLVAQLAEVLSAAPIVFGPDTADLPGPSAASVQQVAELLVAVPAAPVLVEGHVADTPGSVEVEQRLSERRAAVVAEALEAAGVAAAGSPPAAAAPSCRSPLPRSAAGPRSASRRTLVMGRLVGRVGMWSIVVFSCPADLGSGG